MIGSATPRHGEPRSLPQLSVVSVQRPSAPRAAGLDKARSQKNAVRAAETPLAAFKAALPVSLSGRIERFAPTDDGLRRFLHDLGRAVHVNDPDDEAYADGLGLEPETTRRISEPHAQSLLSDFRQRQRRANLVVSVCLGSCLVLTILGIATVAILVGRDTDSGHPAVAKHSTSMAWHKADAGAAGAMLLSSSASPERSLKSEQLPVRVEATPSESELSHASTMPELIMMQEGHELALAPLLAQHQAPYLLLRGLPEQAKLSAGQRNPSGAWLVKNEDVANLTLTIAGESSGDYPLEIYALGDGALAQGRQRLVIRVEPEQLQKLSGDMNWIGALSDTALKNVGPATASVAAGSAKSPRRLGTLASLAD